ncbi:MAG: ABC transporter ATP-binding protein [bacterium]|nr:ABC transporter ATP-binding protein [bacterium]
MLQVNGVGITFGGLVALDSVSLEVRPQALFSVIGPNGSGKTTLFNIISGFYRPRAGQVLFDGNDITGLPPHLVARRGIYRTFQNINLFANMTVLENVLAGQHCQAETRLARCILPFGRNWAFEQQEARECLDRVGLHTRASELAGNLSYGDQRRLEIARVLAGKPQLILLDEPTAGLNPSEKTGASKLIQGLVKDLKITVVLVEHDMSVVMGISEEILVLNHGRVIARGSTEEVRNHPQVIEAYLGRRKGA